MIKSQSNSNRNECAVSIHKATHDDAAAIATLARQLADVDRVDTLCDQAAIEALIAIKRDPACHLLVAKHNQKTIGFILFYAGYDLSSDSYGFHLADICVEESYRQKNVGTQLMQALAMQAKDQAREWVSLTVTRHNQSAQYFYQLMQFQAVEVDFYAAGQSALRSWIKS